MVVMYSYACHGSRGGRRLQPATTLQPEVKVSVKLKDASGRAKAKGYQDYESAQGGGQILHH